MIMLRKAGQAETAGAVYRNLHRGIILIGYFIQRASAVESHRRTYGKILVSRKSTIPAAQSAAPVSSKCPASGVRYEKSARSGGSKPRFLH
jgi:hypothetical protein